MSNKALAHLRSCQQIAKKHSLWYQRASALTSLADLHRRRNEFVAAESLLAEAETIAHEMGSKDQFPEIYRGWAQVRLCQGQVDQAQSDAEHSVGLARELGLENEEGMSLCVLGQALLARDQHGSAIAAFERSLALLASRDPYETARTKTQWGLASLSINDTERGKILLHEARTAFQELGARREWATVSEILAHGRL